MAFTKDQSPKQRFLEHLSSFLQRSRLILLVTLITIVVVIIVIAAGSMIRDKRIEESTILVEEAQKMYDEWIDDSTDTEEEKTAIESELRESLNEIQNKYSRSYAAQRALYLSAEIEFNNENWDEAARLYEDLASRFSESHLASVCLMKAGIAYEQSDADENAINAYLSVSTQFDGKSPDVPRALFSIGRLYEKAGMEDTAKSYYNDLLDRFPESSWTNLTKARIIWLESAE